MGVVNAIKDFGYGCKVKISKYSPQICLVLGIVSVVGGTVLACNATLKVNDKIKERDTKLASLKRKHLEILENAEKVEDTELIAMDEKDYKHEVMKTHALTVLDIAKDYAPAVVCTGVGVGLLCNGHAILNKRYLAMTAAYGGLQKSFNDYRANVRMRFGDEIDKELLYGATNVTFTDPNTEEQKTLTCVDISNKEAMECDTRVLFDETSSQFWTKDPVENRHFIELTIHNMNVKLEDRARANNGHAVMFLNEVRERLGLPRTPAGQYLGWIYDPNVISKIDAGVYSAAHTCNKGAINFLDGDEPNVWLNFNVDGNVLEMI